MGKNIFELPNYPVVPLEYDEIVVAGVQMNPVIVDPDNPKPGIKRNLDHMLNLCDSAYGWPPILVAGQVALPKLITFVEFTLCGLDLHWTREEMLNISIMVPGPETEAIGKKAKELDCYIAFGTYTKEEEWPDHFFSASLIVSPQGEVIHNHWKAINGYPGAFGIEYCTTVHEVYDAFVEKNGIDAVWPVARTDIGNLGTYICSEGFNPETARALAFNGAEILIRMSLGCAQYHHTAGLGNQPNAFKTDCQANALYGICTNGGSGWTDRGFDLVQNGGGGGSMIVDPNGRVLNETVDTREAILKELIPIASFRKNHSIPLWLRTELYSHVYNRPSPAGPNLYEDYLPTDVEDAMLHSFEVATKRMEAMED